MSCDFTDEEADPERLSNSPKATQWVSEKWVPGVCCLGLLNHRLRATPSPIEQGVVRAPSLSLQ